MMKGTFDGQIALMGKGASVASLKRDLAGNGMVRIREGELSWVNLMGQIVHIMGAKGWGKKKTTFEELSTSFTVQKGKIFFPDLLLLHKDIELRMWGDIGLDLGLRMEGEAHLPPSATRGLYAKGWNYLKDEQGRLTIPFTLRGNIKDPQVKISTRLIERGIEGVLEELLRKKLR